MRSLCALRSMAVGKLRLTGLTPKARQSTLSLSHRQLSEAWLRLSLRDSALLQSASRTSLQQLACSGFAIRKRDLNFDELFPDYEPWLPADQILNPQRG